MSGARVGGKLGSRVLGMKEREFSRGRMIRKTDPSPDPPGYCSASRTAGRDAARSVDRPDEEHGPKPRKGQRDGGVVVEAALTPAPGRASEQPGSGTGERDDDRDADQDGLAHRRVPEGLGERRRPGRYQKHGRFRRRSREGPDAREKEDRRAKPRRKSALVAAFFRPRGPRKAHRRRYTDVGTQRGPSEEGGWSSSQLTAAVSSKDTCLLSYKLLWYAARMLGWEK